MTSEILPVYDLNDSDIRARITRLTDGLGFGHGSISRLEREAMFGNEDLGVITDMALRSSGILVPIEADDDGCMDGRPVATVQGAIFRGSEAYMRSLHRAKVPGGSLPMIVASRIGHGIDTNLSLMDQFNQGLRVAAESDIHLGAHIDEYAVEHEHSDNCGCGAVDKAPEHLQAIGTYREQISDTLRVIGGATTESHLIGDEQKPGLLEPFIEAAESSRMLKGFAGRAVMNRIIGSEAVVKLLAGPHIETRIAWNRVKGHTIDQALVREITAGRADTFVIDEWRMHENAEKLYYDPVDRQRSVLSQITYGLGVAAVLTRGDLAVDLYEAA